MNGNQSVAAVVHTVSPVFQTATIQVLVESVRTATSQKLTPVGNRDAGMSRVSVVQTVVEPERNFQNIKVKIRVINSIMIFCFCKTIILYRGYNLLFFCH